MGKRIFTSRGDYKGVIYNRKILKWFFPSFLPSTFFAFSSLPCKLGNKLSFLTKLFDLKTYKMDTEINFEKKRKKRKGDKKM